MRTPARRVPALLVLSTMLFTNAVAAQDPLLGLWEAIEAEDWLQRQAAPPVGDYAGLPLNAAARWRAQSWNSAVPGLPQYRCQLPPADAWQEQGAFRIEAEHDQSKGLVVALRLLHLDSGAQRTIYMDGREHPPAHALHSSQGFSTGRWNGHALSVRTTHLKEGWLRRNGAVRSDQSTLTEHIVRHGDLLSWTVIIEDPVYLEEPFVRNREFRAAMEPGSAAAPCITAKIPGETGTVLHHLPGRNPDLLHYSNQQGIPFEAAMGGAATMYPDYLQVLRFLPVPSRGEP